MVSLVFGVIVEDAAWLRKSDDTAHINVAELDAILRGVNLALKWKAVKFEILTDSATVKGWLDSVFLSTHKARAHGIAEMLVRRRLNMLNDLMVEYGLDVAVTLVPSSQNKADTLTRVPKAWLGRQNGDRSEQVLAALSLEQLRSSHCLHHFGVDRSLSIARQQYGSDVSRCDVSQVVEACPKCRSVDPAPIRWNHGTLGVDKTWYRLSMDITHYDHKLYLTIVDCGPGRFAIWRRISSEAAENICRELKQIFQERGPPTEILMDNGTSFRSSQLENLCEKWAVSRHFRCAYRPETNGVVERNHRTIKRMAARTGGDPIDMVFWYNIAERVVGNRKTAPSQSVSTYQWRSGATLGRNNTAETDGSDSEGELGDFERVEKTRMVPRTSAEFEVGDKVVVKPPGAKCTTEWKPAVVTSVNSEQSVDVEGMPRHVSDIRHAPETSSSCKSDDEEGVEDYRARLRPRTARPNYRV